MAATEKKNIWLHATADGVAPEVRTNQKIAATQGIMIPNAPMYLSTSGTWKASDTSDGTGDVIHGFFVGIENADTAFPIAAALAENTEIRVLIVDPADTYAVYTENNGSDAAAAQAQVGNSYGLTVSATAGQVGYTTLDTNNANGTVKVSQVMGNIETQKFDLTSTPGVCLVKFLAANSTEADKA